MLSNSQTQSHTSDSSKQPRALTGTVTKLLDNFGFIDDSVFFQLSVVKGGDVQVGDKVYCECSYSEHLPFKWNATKVHLVQTNSRMSGANLASQSAQSSASQVATTYLQHRLQQQQQSREESSNPMAGIVNPSHNYYSSQSVSTPTSYSTQQSYDFNKAQQAVVAAQQLANYYGRNDNNSNSFSQLQYTSTPGSAFVSSTLPFTQQIQANLLSTQTRNTPQNNYKSSASRWEREERNRSEDRFRSRDSDRSRVTDSGRKRHDSRDRNGTGKEGRDEFGRDLRNREKDRDREREREREREKIEKERKVKRSESPNSVTGQNAVLRAPRRRYEPVNIPKLAILKDPLNVYDIKQRYSANLHVPSDLKEVIPNTTFSLNINDIPKPITFRVIDTKEENKRKDSNKKSETSKDSEKKETKEENNESKAESVSMEVEDSNNKTDSKDKTSVDQPIALKQTYKYGVKVLIISLPSMNDIYDRIFGSDFDAISTGSKAYFLHFNKLLAFLVSRNSNDGFSLIGGKFSPHLDGYISDTEEPNLIATAVRVVGEQTGMNLSKCGKWKLISTFVYNRDNSVDPMCPNLELTRVYMPDVWSAFDGIYDSLKQNKNIDLENNEFENVLTNDNFKIISDEVIVITNNHKNQLIEENNTNESSDKPQENLQNSLPEDSSITSSAEPLVSSDPPVVDSAMDLSQSNPLTSEDIPSESMESVPIVEPTSSVDATPICTPSEAIDLSSNTALIDSSEQQIVELPSVDNSSPKPQEDIEDSTNSSSNPTNVESELQLIPNESTQKESDTTTPPVVEKTAISGDASELQLLLSRINDLKVAELRAELEKRGARLKGNLKKADLITKLRQIITQLLEDEDIVSDEVKNDWWAQRILSKEVANNDTNDNETIEVNDNNDNETIEVNDDHNKTDTTNECPVIDDKTDKDTNESTDVVMIDSENSEKVENEINEECVNITQENNDSEMVDTTDDKDANEATIEAEVTPIDDNETQNKEKPESEEHKSSQNGTVKRKSDSQSPPKDSKKSKNGEEVIESFPKKVVDGCVYVKGGENLTVITLHEALNHQRYDQFEMSIVSELIRESLIHHFSHYILSTLVNNYRHPVPKDDKNSQDLKPTPLPVNYVHLSFAYFDSSHCGHILSEDLAKLLNNANFTLSRRAFNLLVNSEEKVVYRDLIEPKELLKIKKNKTDSKPDSMTSTQVKIVEKNGTVYDIDQLIELSESDEKLKVRLTEELAQNKDKMIQLNEYITELENRQKKMTIATEKQNDEICSLKREREVLRNKYDSMKKAVEVSVSTFSELLKTPNEENK